MTIVKHPAWLRIEVFAIMLVTMYSLLTMLFPYQQWERPQRFDEIAFGRFVYDSENLVGLFVPMGLTIVQLEEFAKLPSKPLISPYTSYPTVFITSLTAILAIFLAEKPLQRASGSMSPYWTKTLFNLLYLFVIAQLANVALYGSWLTIDILVLSLRF